MRRRLVLALPAAVVLVAGLWALLTPGSAAPPDVVATFDDAAHLVRGQDVRIAGANAGTVRSIHLTAGRKALVAMDVDGAYLPFHADAQCTIRPQSLIGERYVDCSPGTPRAAALPHRADGAQLLPVGRTSAPVDLDLVLDTLDRPVSERLALILNSLGAGLSGRAEDLSAIIERATPTLHDADRVLDVLGRDRDRIARLVVATDRVLAGVAARRAAVPRFIRRTGALLAVTARRRSQLATTLQRLPALLRTTRGALQELRGAAQDGLPVARGLRRAAPSVTAMIAALPAAADAGTPAVRTLGTTSRGLLPAVRALRPVAAAARPFARVARPAGGLVDTLLGSLQTSGATRGLLTFLQNAALATSRYDTVSHVLTATQLTGQCSLYATTPAPGCSAHFAAGKAAAEAVTATRRAPRPTAALPQVTTPLGPHPAAQVTTDVPTTTVTVPGLPPIRVPDAADLGRRTADELGSIVGYLLG